MNILFNTVVFFKIKLSISDQHFALNGVFVPEFLYNPASYNGHIAHPEEKWQLNFYGLLLALHTN
jgi:hypothetical protein